MSPLAPGLRPARRLLVLAGMVGALGLLTSLVLIASGRPVRSSEMLPQVATSAPTSIWAALLAETPIAYSGTPLPASSQTPIDGTYVKLDPNWPQWWLCFRCADYRPAGGIWKLHFEGGVMRILYDVTGWRSLAWFSLEEDRLRVFHDAYCREVGTYSWELRDGSLHLSAIEDKCAFGLRGTNLSRQAWIACPAETEAAGASSGVGAPPGCLDSRPGPVGVAGVPSGLRIETYPGDSRRFPRPPDLFARASPGKTAAPEGIDVAFSPVSISYGINRILWWDGPWIEVRTDRALTAMGVQFLGAPQIGWAQVLFDGVKVWRGITSEIGCRGGSCGGYIEVSGFGPGPHVLRVESVVSDYRPVEVMGFGFSLTGQVDDSP